MDSTSQPPENENFFENDLDRIIAELAAGVDKLPRQAIRETREHRDQMVPKLIEVLEKATAGARAGEDIERTEGNAHFFALCLLTEFRAKEALPAILDMVSLPGKLPGDLLGDAIHSILPRSLATLAGDEPEVMDSLIRNRDLNEYVRWTAATSFMHLLRDGRMTRDEVFERLHQHLREALENKDDGICLGLVLTLNSLAPKEALEDIQKAFEVGLIDPFEICMEDIERSISGGDAWVRKELKYIKPAAIEDTIAELEHWAAFDEKPRRTSSPPPSLPGPVAMPEAIPEDYFSSGAPEMPMESRKDRAGRNDPCPCGSGKKFKKCCGARRG